MNGDCFAVGKEELRRLKNVLTVVGAVVVHDSWGLRG